MRILFTHRYFWPDTPPYANMLRCIAEAMRDRGHKVSVFASVPSYGPKIAARDIPALDGLPVARVPVFQENKRNMVARVANVLIYCSALFFHILRQRPDVVTASTFPPVLAAWAASLAARIVGAKFIYHMQDVHPEVSELSRLTARSTLLTRTMRMFDNQTLRRASSIVVLSEDMKNTLLARGIADLPVSVINNFLLEKFSEAPAAPDQTPAQPSARRRIIFAGNMGWYQNLQQLTEGVVGFLDKAPDYELLFLGGGVAKPELIATWGTHPQVLFQPFVPFEEARVLIEAADIGLVSLSANIYRVSFPSKVLTYLGLGLPLLVMVESDSALARLTKAAGIGQVPDAFTPEAVETAITALAANLPAKTTVKTWYDKTYSAEIAYDQWAALFANPGRSVTAAQATKHPRSS